MKDHSNDVVKTADVIGKNVINRENEKLGKIEEIVLEKVSGQTRYAVLSFGGFLGLGDDLYAIPWQAMEYCPEENSFIINIDKEKLKTASGFNKDNWPDFADPTWLQSFNDFYNF